MFQLILGYIPKQRKIYFRGQAQNVKYLSPLVDKGGFFYALDLIKEQNHGKSRSTKHIFI